jgi:CRISPR/Cas system CSM-associated protein Csm2 small subunit
MTTPSFGTRYKLRMVNYFFYFTISIVCLVQIKGFQYPILLLNKPKCTSSFQFQNYYQNRFKFVVNNGKVAFKPILTMSSINQIESKNNNESDEKNNNKKKKFEPKKIIKNTITFTSSTLKAIQFRTNKTTNNLIKKLLPPFNKNPNINNNNNQNNKLNIYLKLLKLNIQLFYTKYKFFVQTFVIAIFIAIFQFTKSLTSEVSFTSFLKVFLFIIFYYFFLLFFNLYFYVHFFFMNIFLTFIFLQKTKKFNYIIINYFIN